MNVWVLRRGEPHLHVHVPLHLQQLEWRPMVFPMAAWCVCWRLGVGGGGWRACPSACDLPNPLRGGFGEGRGCELLGKETVSLTLPPCASAAASGLAGCGTEGGWAKARG